MSPVKLEETITLDFITSNSTGAATDADSLPTCEVFEDNNDTAIVSPTVTKRTGKTGNYRVPIACTSGSGFEAGKSYNVIVSATVGAVAAKACIASFQVRAASIDDVAAYIDTEVGAIKAKTDNLPVAPAAVGDIPTVLQIATAVWDKATSALTTAGSIGKLIVDKLGLITNSGSVTIVSPTQLEGSEITGLRGDKWSVSITGLGDISGRTKLWFTVKRQLADADSDAILQIIEGTGLVVLNGSSTGLTAADASIVVDDAAAGDLTLTVESSVTALLETGQTWAWDIQILPGPSTKVQGTLIVTGDVTQAIS